VVLTNASAIGKGKTHRVSGKKYRRSECLGFYHPQQRGEQAWIEIIVDNIAGKWSTHNIVRFLTYVPPVQDIAFMRTVYHELGHHLDRTIGALAQGRESTAEAWMKRLSRAYFLRRYWYLKPFLKPAYAVLKRIVGKDADH